MMTKDNSEDQRGTRSVVIIGASLAGGACVARLRALGYDGQITVIDPDPLAPYDRPPLSKGVLTRAAPIEKPRWWCDDCTLLRGRAVALDPRARRIEIRGSDGHRRFVSADAIVIATGARPRRLPTEPAGVLALRTAADAKALSDAIDRGAKSATIIGAGVLGCELASSLRERGVEVAMADLAPLPLVRIFGAEIGKMAVGWMTEAGVTLHLGVGIAAIRAEPAGFSVDLSGGTELHSDLVIIAIGAEPETEWLTGSGIGIANGVLCDGSGAVLDLEGAILPNVFAAGDVAALRDLNGNHRRHEAWTAARRQGTEVAERILTGSLVSAPDAEDYFWTDQFSRKIQVLGSVPANGTLNCFRTTARRHGALFEVRDGERHAGWIAMNCPELLAQVQAGLLAAE